MLYCENHPKKEANTRCKYCWKAICPSCAIMVDEEPFCSRRCRTLFVINNLWLQVRQILFKQNLYLRAKVAHFNKYSTFFLILISLSIGLLLLNSTNTEEKHTEIPTMWPQVNTSISPSSNEKIVLSQEIKDTKVKKNNIGTKKDPDSPSSLASPSLGPSATDPNQDFTQTLTFKIGLAPDYPKPPPYIVAICGQAPTDSIIALYNNDRLCDTVPCSKGRFLFPRIRLTNEKNLLQAKLITPQGDFWYSNKLELFVDVSKAQIQEKGTDILRGNINNLKICLSFDGGSDAENVPFILDTLKEKRIQTTIFLTGEFIRRNPAIVKRMIEEGHEIGNHTDTHPHLAKFEEKQFKTLPWVNKEFLHRELKKAEEAFYHVTGKNMNPYWRSPYGGSNLEIRKWAEELGYTHISWTCGRVWEEGLDTFDWVNKADALNYHTAEEIQDQIINFGKGTTYGANGGIVLMHLNTARPFRESVYSRLPQIIDGLRERGYEIVKISDLLQDTSSLKERKEQAKSAKTERSRSKLPIKKIRSNVSQKNGRRRSVN